MHSTPPYIGFLFVLMINACIQPPDFSETPKIEFDGWSKNTMNQGDLNTDSIFITLSYEDGDGDLGYPASDPTRDVTVIDNRTGNVQDLLKIPEIPVDGTGNGINGTLSLRLFNTCCLFPRGIPPCTNSRQFPADTITYDIYIEDRAGNRSNVVTTPELILRCNI